VVSSAAIPLRMAGRSPAAIRSRIASSPLSPLMGCAPSRTSFMPLKPFGLWLAVTMIPPSAPWCTVPK
jgi:hypothetical protein